MRNVLKIVLSNLTYIKNVKCRNMPWGYTYAHLRSPRKNPHIIGLIRLRNERLLLKDTLDHVSRFVDGVIVFDDASTDDSVQIAKEHEIVLDIISNKHWKKNARKWEETANRSLIHEYAKRYRPEWFFYFDADERFEGDIKSVTTDAFADVDAVRISLLDAYITPADNAPYHGGNLLNFREKFGIERRDILMLWRNNGKAKYIYPDSREPAGFSRADTKIAFWCQHYGKAVSIEQWEETCKYYAENFPMYAEKWKARMGRGVHEKSDFDTELYNWEDAKSNSTLL